MVPRTKVPSWERMFQGMNSLGNEYSSIRFYLVNCAFDQMRCAADQFTNCAAFDELHNIWSIAQRTCNRVRVKVRIRARVGVRMLGLVLGLDLCNWPNVQRIWSNAQIDGYPRLTKCALH